ncbi:hypothetical protein SK128_017268 [Halocaridina rubra]|uniref:Uncharacterized protein n=1 Tax=Halocaridina rubra TaxID=373956 RepID=A0AAN8WNJ3_HALRR
MVILVILAVLAVCSAQVTTPHHVPLSFSTKNLYQSSLAETGFSQKASFDPYSRTSYDPLTSSYLPFGSPFSNLYHKHLNVLSSPNGYNQRQEINAKYNTLNGQQLHSSSYSKYGNQLNKPHGFSSDYPFTVPYSSKRESYFNVPYNYQHVSQPDIFHGYNQVHPFTTHSRYGHGHTLNAPFGHHRGRNLHKPYGFPTKHRSYLQGPRKHSGGRRNPASEMTSDFIA